MGVVSPRANLCGGSSPSVEGIRVDTVTRAQLASAVIANLPSVRALGSLESSPIQDGEAGGPAPIRTGLSPVVDGTDEWLRRAIAASVAALEASFVPGRPRVADGLGRRVTPGGVREGDVLWAPHGVRGFGPRCEHTIPAGSYCVATRDAGDPSFVHVRFEDPDTGEVLLGDARPDELRWPVERAVRRADGLVAGEEA